MAVSAAIHRPHFQHFLCRVLWFVIMPVVFGDAVEAAPTNETAGVAKVAIPACRGNVRCARVHVSMAGLVWLLLAVHFSLS